MSKGKVIVGLSGGVDSAVACILLQEEGYDVAGLFMRNWDSALNNDVLGNPNDLNSVCPQEVDYQDALSVADALNIPLYRVDFVTEYWENVFEEFLAEYKKNRTPNPDVLCNKEIKFKCFIEKAKEIGCDFIATGHYARVIKKNGKNFLLKGKDTAKDQSYFLYKLSSAQLENVLFPLGNLTKPEVRQIALKHNLKVSLKKDSTGICFIGERRFKSFLTNYLSTKRGEMKTLKGASVGWHDGTCFYTIGQRRGLKIGGKGSPWYVIGKRPKENVLLVGQNEDLSYLYSDSCIVEDYNLFIPEFKGEKECFVKFRYRQKDIPCKITLQDKCRLLVTYLPARAVTPGQAAVFYDGDLLMGGGTISLVYMGNELREY